MRTACSIDNQIRSDNDWKTVLARGIRLLGGMLRALASAK